MNMWTEITLEYSFCKYFWTQRS